VPASPHVRAYSSTLQNGQVRADRINSIPLASGRSSNSSCWLASSILDGCYGGSIATPATANCGCSTLTPVVPEGSVFAPEWPELADSCRSMPWWNFPGSGRSYQHAEDFRTISGTNIAWDENATASAAYDGG
jgi:hypothetical protein